jgi:hypothetical protein
MPAEMFEHVKPINMTGARAGGERWS